MLSLHRVGLGPIRRELFGVPLLFRPEERDCLIGIGKPERARSLDQIVTAG